MGILAHAAVSGSNRSECIAEALLAAVGAAGRGPGASRGIAIGTEVVAIKDHRRRV